MGDVMNVDGSTFHRGMMTSRPNSRARNQAGTGSGDGTSVPGWMSFWSTSAFTNKKSTVASAIYTIVFSCIMLGFSSYELYKIDQFWNRYHDAQTKSYAEKPGLFNKDMQPVTDTTILYFINISTTEKGLLAAFICLCIGLIISSVILIICTAKEKKEFVIPWFMILLIVVIYGSTIVIMDCIVYEFGAENNLQLLVWVSFVFGAVHSLRCVGIYYRHLAGTLRPRARPHISTAEFDPRQANDHGIFTTSQSVEPVIIQMTPPPYEKDPPVYSLEPEDVSSAHTSNTNLSTDTDKPPDYSP